MSVLKGFTRGNFEQLEFKPFVSVFLSEMYVRNIEQSSFKNLQHLTPLFRATLGKKRGGGAEVKHVI